MLKSCEHGHDDMCVHFESTSYKTFLDILEFRGMGIGNRYRLTACVENRIRELYPCPKGQYTGFIGLGQAGTLKNY